MRRGWLRRTARGAVSPAATTTTTTTTTTTSTTAVGLRRNEQVPFRTVHDVVRYLAFEELPTRQPLVMLTIR